MSEAKIEIKIGEIQFFGEGSEKWLSGELDKILLKAKALVDLVPPTHSTSSPVDSATPSVAHDKGHTRSMASTVGLATFLNNVSASKKSQAAKFLATASWLHEQGHETMQTIDVTQALSKAKQKKLKNSSGCLRTNERRGFCDKTGKQFFVTPEGRKSLGLE